MDDAILDRWAAGEKMGTIRAALQCDAKTVANTIERARYRKDPRVTPHQRGRESKHPQEWRDRLAAMWADGMSGGEIASVLGVTRNTVLGAVARAHLPRPQFKLPPKRVPREKPNGPQARFRAVRVQRRQIERAHPVTPIGVVFRPPVIEAQPSLKLSLLALPKGGCKWPSGHPGEPDFSFCAHPQFPASVYCEPHSRLAYTEEGFGRVQRRARAA